MEMDIKQTFFARFDETVYNKLPNQITNYTKA